VAESLFHKAIALSPSDEEAETHYAIVNTYFCLGRSVDIIRWCEKVIKEYPTEQKEALLFIANCYYEVNDIMMCLKTLAVYWKINNENIDDEVINDKRFNGMFAYITGTLNDTNFNLNDYL
jgi:tetratricopeptide (TPR) repeat protein